MANMKHIINMANSIVGVSILSMPYCFKECGLILGVLLILLCGYITKTTCMFLIKAAIMARRRSYELLAFQVFGPTGKLLVEMCMIMFLIGMSISFQVVMGDLAPSIVAKYIDVPNSPSLRATLLIGMLLLVILPLCFLRHLESLSSMSACSMIFYIFINCVIVSMALPNIFDGMWIHNANLFVPSKAFRVLPIMMLGLSCQSNVFEIYDSIHDADVFKIKHVVDWAVNLCSALYIGVGVFGYIAYADSRIPGNIIMSFPSSMTKDVITLFFVASLAISFPLILFPCRTSIHSLLFRRGGQMAYELMGNYMPETRFKAITVAVLLFSLVVGILIPDIEFVLGLVGSTVGVGIALALPSLFYMYVYNKMSTEKLLAQFIFLLSLFILLTGTYLHLFGSGGSYSESQAVFLEKSTQREVLPKIPIKNPVESENIISNKVVEVNNKDARREPVVPEPPPEKPDNKVPPSLPKQGDPSLISNSNQKLNAKSVPDAPKLSPETAKSSKNSRPKPSPPSGVSDNADAKEPKNKDIPLLQPDDIKKEINEAAAETKPGAEKDNVIVKQQQKVIENLEKSVKLQDKLIERQEKFIDQLQEQQKVENVDYSEKKDTGERAPDNNENALKSPKNQQDHVLNYVQDRKLNVADGDDLKPVIKPDIIQNAANEIDENNNAEPDVANANIPKSMAEDVAKPDKETNHRSENGEVISNEEQHPKLETNSLNKDAPPKPQRKNQQRKAPLAAETDNTRIRDI